MYICVFKKIKCMCLVMIAMKWPHPPQNLLLVAGVALKADDLLVHAHSSEIQADDIVVRNYDCMETSGFYSV